MNAGLYLFTGQDALGYERGRVYFLNFLPSEYPVQIDGPYACAYRTMQDFFENWRPA